MSYCLNNLLMKSPVWAEITTETVYLMQQRCVIREAFYSSSEHKVVQASSVLQLSGLPPFLTSSGGLVESTQVGFIGDL